ncbi:hypothetical protein GFL15_30570 [Rhizobium leguminosarum bv. viciae]|nr:hypothetical protein [Rhizobium leguminosarum bv. viciae]
MPIFAAQSQSLPPASAPPERTRDISDSWLPIHRRANYRTSLSDPDKVDDLIKRFTAMYDMANGTGTASTALSILTGSAAISANTLRAVAQLKSG